MFSESKYFQKIVLVLSWCLVMMKRVSTIARSNHAECMMCLKYLISVKYFIMRSCFNSFFYKHKFTPKGKIKSYLIAYFFKDNILSMINWTLIHYNYLNDKITEKKTCTVTAYL